MFREFVKHYSRIELTKREKTRINKDLKEMGAGTLVRQLVNATYNVVVCDRSSNKKKLSEKASKYKKLTEDVINEASRKLLAGIK